MKKRQIWIWLTILATLLLAGCIAANEPEPTQSENTGADNGETSPTASASETAVPLPIVTKANRAIRLTPDATVQIEGVPTLEEPASLDEIPEEIMTAVYQDLLTTANISQEEIKVSQAEAVVWSDGSLGCPQPGVSYTQATVPGYWIVLEANGRSYSYHATENGYFVLCQNGLPSSPPILGTPTS